MAVEIANVSTNRDIDCVASLARVVWTEHFTPIIGGLQVEYMLAKYQSPKAIESQIADGAEYYLATIDNQAVGYVGLIPDWAGNKMMLSKLYLKAAMRGKGVGKKLLDFVEGRCVSANVTTVWLTVNRFNEGTVSWYKRRGFVVIDEVKKDIGEGYFMDDYIMEKSLSKGYDE